MKKNSKFKIGILSLTSCEGCCFAILDSKEKYLKSLNHFDWEFFRLWREEEDLSEKKFDIVFVEGSPITNANIEQLKIVRKNSRYLATLGTCAHFGGIYHLKNYGDKLKLIKKIYDKPEGIENPDVLPVRDYVRVDFDVPTCPIDVDEFFSMLYDIEAGRLPKIAQKTICYDCQRLGYECVLQKGEICLGPITQTGCNAVCLKSKQGCWGCRGLIKDAEVENLMKFLKKNHSIKEIEQALEVFGMKDYL
ncbi:MAG TPA: hypothetical protein VMX18_00915 [Candidatus Bipolaricaulota bacterium]|nr:hypothetical protein [Candidatus Bipolaricaulota bacterium]